MHIDDEEEDNLPTWNLSTSDDEENDKIEDPIDPAKPSSSAAEKNETALLPHIHLYLIVVTTYPVFPSAKDNFMLL